MKNATREIPGVQVVLTVFGEALRQARYGSIHKSYVALACAGMFCSGAELALAQSTSIPAARASFRVNITLVKGASAPASCATQGGNGKNAALARVACLTSVTPSFSAPGRSDVVTTSIRAADSRSSDLNQSVFTGGTSVSEVSTSSASALSFGSTSSSELRASASAANGNAYAEASTDAYSGFYASDVSASASVAAGSRPSGEAAAIPAASNFESFGVPTLESAVMAVPQGALPPKEIMVTF